MSLRVRKLSEEPGVDEQEEGFSGVNSVWAVLKRTDLTGFSSRIFRMEPGGHTANHVHDREHVAVVVSGTCRVEGSEETRTVGAGNIVAVPQNLPHRFSNPGPGRLVLLIMNFFMNDEKDEMATSDEKSHQAEGA
jgi:quercetin dioxygenase-like cupin family protein